MKISAHRDPRFSFDPDGANSIVPVYRYIKNAWNLRQSRPGVGVEEVARSNSRHESHIRDFDHFSLFDAPVMVLTNDLALARNRERIG